MISDAGSTFAGLPLTEAATVSAQDVPQERYQPRVERPRVQPEQVWPDGWGHAHPDVQQKAEEALKPVGLRYPAMSGLVYRGIDLDTALDMTDAELLDVNGVGQSSLAKLRAYRAL